jgi:P4 family phage/plasmid primase-like protien
MQKIIQTFQNDSITHELDSVQIDRFIDDGDDGLADMFVRLKKDDIKALGPNEYAKFDIDTGLWKLMPYTGVVCEVSPALSPILSSHLKTQCNDDEKAKRTKKALASVKTISFQILLVKHHLSFKLLAPGFKEELDSKQNLLSFRNGVVDLTTGVQRRAQRQDYLSFDSALAYDFDGNASTQDFERFLMDICNQNVQYAHYLGRLLGYGITGEVQEQVVAIFHGPRGGNGKTVLCNILKQVMGAMFKTATKDVFCNSNMKSCPGSTTSHLAALRGSRFAVCDESLEGDRLAVDTLKNLTGGGEISTRDLYQKYCRWKPQFLPILLTNFAPSFDAVDAGMARRIINCPFEVYFRDQSAQDYDAHDNKCKVKDDALVKRLINNPQGAAAYLVQQAMLYYRDGLLDKPEAVVHATKEHVNDCDELGLLIEESFETTHSNSDFTLSQDLLDVFRSRFMSTAMNLKGLCVRMQRKGFTKAKQTRGVHKGQHGYFGIRKKRLIASDDSKVLNMEAKCESATEKWQMAA